jgi:hypothetical protein
VNHMLWWAFRVNACGTAYVPGASEAEARRSLRAHCYDDAPVGEWSFLRVVMGSREQIVQMISGRAEEAG